MAIIAESRVSDNGAPLASATLSRMARQPIDEAVFIREQCDGYSQGACAECAFYGTCPNRLDCLTIMEGRAAQ